MTIKKPGKPPGRKPPEEHVDPEDLIAHVLKDVACGISVRKSCSELGYSHFMFFHLLRSRDDAREAYYIAKAEGIHALLDDLDDKFREIDDRLKERIVVDTPDGQIEVPKYDPKAMMAMVHNCKNRVDARKWKASKLLPKTYGDKIMVGDNEGKTIPTVYLTVGSSSDQEE